MKKPEKDQSRGSSEAQGDAGLERRLQNLAPRWKKGKSGNPAGRPKGSKDGLRACLKRKLRAAAPDELKAIVNQFGMEDPASVADALVTRLISDAANGGQAAIRLCLEQTEQPQSARGLDAPPVTINLIAPPAPALDAVFEVEVPSPGAPRIEPATAERAALPIDSSDNPT